MTLREDASNEAEEESQYIENVADPAICNQPPSPKSQPPALLKGRLNMAMTFLGGGKLITGVSFAWSLQNIQAL